MGINNSNLSSLESNIRKLEIDNRELTKQINSLKNINIIQKSQIIKKHKINLLENNNQKAKKQITEVSKDKIGHYVEKLLENSDTNISYLPDFVEKKIYTNILTVCLNLLDDMLETTSIKFVGHEIAFDLRECPLEKTSTEQKSE